MAPTEVKFFAVGPYSYNKPVRFTVKRYPFSDQGWAQDEVLHWLKNALTETIAREAHDKRRSGGKAARSRQAVRVRG